MMGPLSLSALVPVVQLAFGAFGLDWARRGTRSEGRKKRRSKEAEGRSRSGRRNNAVRKLQETR